MKQYAVVFENSICSNKCGEAANWVPQSQQFNDLKGAREYAKQFWNSSIYRVEWTDGNGYQFVRKLKTI